LEDTLVGRLAVQVELLSETRDYYYFIKYRPVVTLEQPLVLRASMASAQQEVGYRYISYPAHEQKLREGTITAETPPDLQDGVLQDPGPLTKGMNLPEHSLYVDGEDFSLH